MAVELSKKEWLIGIFSVTFIGLIIVGRVVKTAAAQPRQTKMTCSIKGQNFKNCGCSD